MFHELRSSLNDLPSRAHETIGSGGGLIFLRRIAPLPRRDVAYYSGALYTLAGPLKLGIIPTVAPYLMPLILGPLRAAYPGMAIELWEDLTGPLLSLLATQRLDAALIATEIRVGTELTAIPLFVEPFLAALPEAHPLAERKRISAKELSDDLLVLADGHCLADQALSACGKHRSRLGPFQASSLDTLVNLVAAGYGATLIPELAAGLYRGRSIVLRPLKERVSRTIRLASRGSFPRPQALHALEKVIRQAMSAHHLLNGS